MLASSGVVYCPRKLHIDLAAVGPYLWQLGSIPWRGVNPKACALIGDG
jgi:hypothetical protein